MSLYKRDWLGQVQPPGSFCFPLGEGDQVGHTPQLGDARRLQGQEGTEVTPWGPLKTPELEVLQEPAETSPTAIPLQ